MCSAQVLITRAFPVWIQQIITINLEARRKDYWQMFTHHIITTILMSLSYILNFTRIGSAILCTMDVVDILLPVSSTIKLSCFTFTEEGTCAKTLA